MRDTRGGLAGNDILKCNGAVHAGTSAPKVPPFPETEQTLMHNKSFQPASNLGDEKPHPEMGL